MTNTTKLRRVADEEPLGTVVEVRDDGTVRIAMSFAQARRAMEAGIELTGPWAAIAWFLGKEGT